ncbi:hypothetical protein [Candidatus Palauibacter sp.]|uniref:hypothetical protein n=1 Tax=Candidatus Palauibacter sp. TaxID=3101350 RepID=UPI003B024FEE
MSRFNPFHARFRRVALLLVLLTASSVAAQEVVVTISSNTCWNSCSEQASEVYNGMSGGTGDERYAAYIAEVIFEDCMAYCEWNYELSKK